MTVEIIALVEKDYGQKILEEMNSAPMHTNIGVKYPIAVTSAIVITVIE